MVGSGADGVPPLIANQPGRAAVPYTTSIRSSLTPSARKSATRPAVVISRGPVGPGSPQHLFGRPPHRYVSRRSAAHRVSWCRVDSCSLRSTDDTCDSTVLTEMYSSRAISLYV